MNNLDNDTLLGKAPIPRAVAAMAIPSVISSLVTVVYNMADTFFVGQTGDALQVAAVSLTNPIFILLMAFANMFGMGGSAMISVALGESNHQSVKKISSFISWASLVVGAAFAAVLLCFTAPILHLFGADASTFEFARGYTVYIAFGAPFVIWSAAASFVVRAEGASKEAMIGSMIGTIANIVLDPVFVSGLGQGAAGAAIATTIGIALIIAVIATPKTGYIATYRRQRHLRRHYRETMMLCHIYTHMDTPIAHVENGIGTIHEHLNWRPDYTHQAASQLKKQGLLYVTNGHYVLTDKGIAQVKEII